VKFDGTFDPDANFNVHSSLQFNSHTDSVRNISIENLIVMGIVLMLSHQLLFTIAPYVLAVTEPASP
jgi:hypothetical protein